MAKSLQQFRGWAVAAGSVATPAGTYKGQCVSLVQQYLTQVFNIPFAARGNAKDFVPPTFVRVSNYRAGDIIRYGSNYGGGYGHIGLIDDTGAFLDQNGTRVLAVGRRSTPFSGINAIFRPTKPFNVKTPVPAKPKTTVRTTTNLNLRAHSNTKYPVIAVVPNGTILTITGTQPKGQKINGNSKWYFTNYKGHGGTVWAGGTNKP